MAGADSKEERTFKWDTEPLSRGEMRGNAGFFREGSVKVHTNTEKRKI